MKNQKKKLLIGLFSTLAAVCCVCLCVAGFNRFGNVENPIKQVVLDQNSVTQENQFLESQNTNNVEDQKSKIDLQKGQISAHGQNQVNAVSPNNNSNNQPSNPAKEDEEQNGHVAQLDDFAIMQVYQDKVSSLNALQNNAVGDTVGWTLNANGDLHVGKNATGYQHSYNSADPDDFINNGWWNDKLKIKEVYIDSSIQLGSAVALFGCVNSYNPQEKQVHLMNIRGFHNLENLDLQYVTDTSFMFVGCDWAEIKEGGIPSNLNNVTDATAMLFYTAISEWQKEHGGFTNETMNDFAKALTSAKELSFAFAKNYRMTSFDGTNLNNAQNISNMISNDVNIKEIDISTWTSFPGADHHVDWLKNTGTSVHGNFNNLKCSDVIKADVESSIPSEQKGRWITDACKVTINIDDATHGGPWVSAEIGTNPGFVEKGFFLNRYKNESSEHYQINFNGKDKKYFACAGANYADGFTDDYFTIKVGAGAEQQIKDDLIEITGDVIITIHTKAIRHTYNVIIDNPEHGFINAFGCLGDGNLPYEFTPGQSFRYNGPEAYGQQVEFFADMTSEHWLGGTQVITNENYVFDYYGYTVGDSKEEIVPAPMVNIELTNQNVTLIAHTKPKPVPAATAWWGLSSDNSTLYLSAQQTTEANTKNDIIINGFTKASDAPWNDSKWDISKVVIQDNGEHLKFKSANYLFSGLSNCLEIEGLKTADFSECTSMKSMFNGCRSVTQLDLSMFNTSNVTDMQYMFSSCKKVTQLDLSKFNTFNVTYMQGMFSDCGKLEQIINLSGFDTSNVENMSYMFSSCEVLKEIDLSGFDTSKVNNMASMFFMCRAVKQIDVSDFDTSNVTDMSYMFNSCIALTQLDVSNFNTSSVINMNRMFSGCEELLSVNVSKLDTLKVTNMSAMFMNCTALQSLDLSSFDTHNLTTFSNIFTNCNFNTFSIGDKWDKNLQSCGLRIPAAGGWFDKDNPGDPILPANIPLNKAATYVDVNPTTKTAKAVVYAENGEDTLMEFVYDNKIYNAGDVVEGHEQYGAVRTTYDVKYTNVGRKIAPDWVDLDEETSSANPKHVNFAESFKNAKYSDGGDVSSLSGFCYGMNNFVSTSASDSCVTGWSNIPESVTDLSYLMYYSKCKDNFQANLDLTDLTSDKVNNVTNMMGHSLTGTLTLNANFLPGITNFSSSGSPFADSNFSNYVFNKNADGEKYGKNISNFSNMFRSVNAYTLNLTNVDFSQAVSFNNMFLTCISLTSITFDPELKCNKLETLSSMFEESSNLQSIDLSFITNTSAIKNINNMFSGCSDLTTIIVNDNWSLSDSCYGSWVFDSCKNLVGGQGTSFTDKGVTDKSYARIDDGPDSSAPGYFTSKNPPAFPTAIVHDVSGKTADIIIRTKSDFETWGEYVERSGGKFTVDESSNCVYIVLENGTIKPIYNDEWSFTKFFQVAANDWICFYDTYYYSSS